ncbi:MAG: folate-binding protein YgfZ [Planctomycetes bacterium]|nr:folate-binding protein YgfZ [Planctomycetota bacterium]MBI3836198.1 folate-binding protein YgfZ [Planctomycetota bacterium]
MISESAISPSRESGNESARKPEDLASEYGALHDGIAICPVNWALIEIQGKDRISWLHNLTTNQVKTLQQNEGNYSFATNAKGRILFDLIAVNRGDCLWVSVDQLFLDRAITHFNKYIVMEDVQVRDRSMEFAVFGVSGAKAPKLLANLGLPQARATSQYSAAEVNFDGRAMTAMRNDFCGPFGVQFFVSREMIDAFRKHISDSARPETVCTVGDEVIQIRRIEAGIPWPGFEITDEYLPAETRQTERAVSFQKGCYLGQEVVERMRSRSVVARLLSGLTIEGENVPPIPSQLTATDGSPAGTLTSACRSIAKGSGIGLGYVKTGAAESGTVLSVNVGDQAVRCTVVSLPHVPSQS